MTRLYEPHKPHKPTPPEEPQRTLKAGHTIQLGPEERNFPKEFSHLTLDQAAVKVAADCYGHIEIFLKLLVDAPNPWYDKKKRWLPTKRH